MQIARRSLAGPGAEGVETHQSLLHEWDARRDRLEIELARQLPEMNLEHRLRAGGMLTTHGVSDATYASALAHFGEQGVVELAALSHRQ